MSKYRYCGGSQAGKSHERSSIVCQDAFCILDKEDFIIAAVADGLGSSKHSDIAADMAANSVAGYCADHICNEMNDEQILSVIKNAFDNTNYEIKQKANDCPDDYDTTLTLAVFIEGIIYFGHAGDSGIIALRTDGVFEKVTEQQLGDGEGVDLPVYPLAAKSRWVFGKYKQRAGVIFLMTDGILNKVIPYLLKSQEYKMDHAYLYYLYDNMRKNQNLDDWIKDELSLIIPNEVRYDDKTLVAILCSSVKIKHRPKAYYEFPSESLYRSLLDEQKNALNAISSSINDKEINKESERI